MDASGINRDEKPATAELTDEIRVRIRGRSPP